MLYRFWNTSFLFRQSETIDTLNSESLTLQLALSSVK